MDSQVKVQGFRVELGEIEFHTREYLQGKNSIAVGFKNITGNSEIALFIEEEIKDKSELLTQLKLRMPSYMIPTKIICYPEFPLNSNGKTDRNALLKLIQHNAS
jgi:acyl-coenzyme A synthetase/AMP-(fatty) acid ligase